MKNVKQLKQPQVSAAKLAARKTRNAGKDAKSAASIKISSVNPRQLARLITNGAIAEGRDGTNLFKNAFGSTAATVAVLTDLARQPENMLACELSSPAVGIIRAISEMTIQAQCVANTKLECESWRQDAGIVLEQLHLALAFIFREIAPTVTVFAQFAKSSDLLIEAINHSIGDGYKAAKLIERYQTIFPNDGKEQDGSIEPQSWPDQFAWDAQERLVALDEMADKYPEHLKTATRQMNAWPMLRYRHTDSKARFEFLADKLELGKDYPLDTSKSARFRPDTCMVRYLDSLVWQFHCFRDTFAVIMKYEKDANRAIERAWKEPDGVKFHQEIAAPLQASLALPRLTKATAQEWAEKAIVPYIVVTGAKTPENCTEPALKRIWRQRRAGKVGTMKSISDFKSRLLPDVVKTLRAMARPSEQPS